MTMSIRSSGYLKDTEQSPVQKFLLLYSDPITLRATQTLSTLRTSLFLQGREAHFGELIFHQILSILLTNITFIHLVSIFKDANHFYPLGFHFLGCQSQYPSQKKKILGLDNLNSFFFVSQLLAASPYRRSYTTISGSSCQKTDFTFI